MVSISLFIYGILWVLTIGINYHFTYFLLGSRPERECVFFGSPTFRILGQRFCIEIVEDKN
jgi:hypothetical protein